ncbi:uncharacterized protein [Montipora foliosa]|uniref:uncharacterized protein n=1 Tax=Montipora foliosa TaxID=591990 RepID=UPI0035F1D46D
MERHYLSDNIDMCGFFARRGEDFIGLLRVCASVLAQQINVTFSLTRELQELISRLESNVFHFQSRQDFLLEGGSLVLPQSYTCETVHNGRQGRPIYKITEFQIWGLRSVGFTWRKILSFFCVSERTLRRRRQEMGWPAREQEFSQISDNALDIVVRDVLSLSLNSGERMVLGALRGRGLLVQRNRVRQSIFRFDPVSRALRRFRTVQGRVYSVTKPNALWHQDGNHKLIRHVFLTNHWPLDSFLINRRMRTSLLFTNLAAKTLSTITRVLLCFLSFPKCWRDVCFPESIITWFLICTPYNMAFATTDPGSLK